MIVAAYSDYLKTPTDLRVPEFVAAPRQAINDAGVTLWTDALAQNIEPGPHTAGPDDLCVMPYTSGTTGKPKGCMHTHRTVMYTLVAGAQWFGINQDATSLAVLPFFHVTGMQGSMNGPMFNGSTVVLQPRWDRDVALVISDGTEVLLVLATQTGYAGWNARLTRTAQECWQSADTRAGATAARAYTGLREEHEQDHRQLFRRCSLDLRTESAIEGLTTDERLRRATGGDDDPGLAALLFNYGRYLLIASSRPGGLSRRTCRASGTTDLQPPWSSNYTLNINTEMNYWPAEVTALPECHEPLLDFVEQLAESGRRTAQELYGCGGWVAHHNADAWCWTAPVGGDPRWANWPMGGAWLCRHLWDHYAFTGDRAFLLRAWPLLRGAAEFCLGWLVEMPDGTLGTSPSTSPENDFVAADGKPASVTQSSTMDLALICDLFARCLSAATDLGIEDPLLARLAAAQLRLPLPAVGSRGQLLEWAQELPETDPHHRHVSHLVGVYPGEAITPDATPDHAAAAALSLDIRGDGGTGWSLAWKVCLRARLRDGAAAHRLVREFLTLVTHEPSTEYGGTGAGVYANLFCAHPPFQIDGNFGATAGIAEMLLQSHTEELHLLPALPLAWDEGSARGLRARGGVAVDVSWSRGRLSEAVLTAAEDRDVVARLGDLRATLSLAAGEPVRIGPGLARVGRAAGSGG